MSNLSRVVYLLLLCSPAIVFPQRSQHTIYGRVALPDDKPAARVQVTIREETGVERQSYTDEMGRFEFRDLARGKYYLSAVNPAVPDQYTDPAEIDLGRSETNYVTVHLFLRNRVRAVPAGRSTPQVVTLAEQRQEIPKPARKAFEQALKLRDNKRNDESLKSFDRAITLYPSYFQAFTERGYLLIQVGRLPEALNDFSKALDLNTLYGPALRGSGLCKFQQGRYADAVEDLKRAADAEPGLATNFYFMGIACLALGQSEQARAALEKSLSLDPHRSVRAHVHLASLLIKEHRPQEAARELETYLAAVPNPFDGDKLRALLTQLRSARP